MSFIGFYLGFPDVIGFYSTGREQNVDVSPTAKCINYIKAGEITFG